MFAHLLLHFLSGRIYEMHMYDIIYLSRLHWYPSCCGHKEVTQRSLFQRIYWPCFSLLMKQKLETLYRLANPSKCLAALLLLVLISKRMSLAGLSEVINIRGHKVMLIEWAPHCNAQEVSLHSESCSFQSHYPIPFSLVCLSYTSLGEPPLVLAFPTDSSKKTGLVWSWWRSLALLSLVRV